MRLFHRKRKFVPPPSPPSQLALALNRWIDGHKRRLADALSHREQRMTLRQKKFALAIFCGLSASLFLFNLYKGFILHPSATYRPAGYIHMPTELPPPTPPTRKLPRSPTDSSSKLIPSDSSLKNSTHATPRQ